MKISRGNDGVLVRFERAEGELLTQVLGDTAEALRPGVLDDDDPVQQRLYPAGYHDDADAEHAFRELTRTALQTERIERAQMCIAEVASAPQRRRGLELVLDPDATQRWLRALNDVRLALGTRLNITEDDDRPLDPSDPDAGGRFAYAWLTGMQDSLVHAAMG